MLENKSMQQVINSCHPRQSAQQAKSLQQVIKPSFLQHGKPPTPAPLPQFTKAILKSASRL
jgi:hypothetical protein